MKKKKDAFNDASIKVPFILQFPKNNKIWSFIILQNMKDSKDQVIGEQNIVSMFYASILLL